MLVEAAAAAEKHRANRKRGQTSGRRETGGAAERAAAADPAAAAELAAAAMEQEDTVAAAVDANTGMGRTAAADTVEVEKPRPTACGTDEVKAAEHTDGAKAAVEVAESHEDLGTLRLESPVNCRWVRGGRRPEGVWETGEGEGERFAAEEEPAGMANKCLFP